MQKVDHFKLLPCPHCAGEAEWTVCDGYPAVIRCTMCDASACRNSPAATTELWNRRWEGWEHVDIVDPKESDYPIQVMLTIDKAPKDTDELPDPIWWRSLDRRK